MPKRYIVKEGIPFIFGAFIIGFLLSYFVVWYAGIIPYLWGIYFAYFFRNPHRRIPQGDDTLVSPADGKVMEISEVYEDTCLHAKCKKITIFLSVFDVHVNRAPMAGKITFRQYICGSFRPAYKDAVGYENERHAISIDNGKFTILVTQIAGVLARRVVSWIDLGDDLSKGQLYGMIKFGSCTEVFMPLDTEICVAKGDRVKGGETVIGRIGHE
ncbi:MAG: phosphatidylserine decarboxylase family protein [Veillonellaceae bacterium]|nr:phosphatidylserine decarboxylase family protein [Veillonellaceae bacterium]